MNSDLQIQYNIRKSEREQHDKNLIPMPINLVQSLNDANGNVAK